MISTIMDSWGGALIQMPIVRNRHDTTYAYKVNGDIRAIISIYKINEDYQVNCDIAIKLDQMKDLFKIDDLFGVPTILAVEFNDMKTWGKVSSLYAKRHHYAYEDNFYIPKSKFNEIKGRQQKA